MGRSPALLASSFLGVLVLWLVFSGYGIVLAPSPLAMVMLESLPPLRSLLLDVQLLVAGRGGGVIALAFGAGLVVIRAALSALWIALVLESLRGELDWRRAIRPALRRAWRSMGAMLVIEAGFLLFAMASFVLAAGFLGASLGQLALIAALIGGLYFFTYAPIVAVSEGLGARAATRVGIRAARVPGPRHMLMAVMYLSLTLFVSVLTPGSRVAAATPTIRVWAFVLFVSFLHVGVLGAFTYRWLALRDPVLAQEERARRGQPIRAPTG